MYGDKILREELNDHIVHEAFPFTSVGRWWACWCANGKLLWVDDSEYIETCFASSSYYMNLWKEWTQRSHQRLEQLTQTERRTRPNSRTTTRNEPQVQLTVCWESRKIPWRCLFSHISENTLSILLAVRLTVVLILARPSKSWRVPREAGTLHRLFSALAHFFFFLNGRVAFSYSWANCSSATIIRWCVSEESSQSAHLLMHACTHQLLTP